jgi:hypothetical protein
MGLRAHDPGWELTAAGERIDWHAIRCRVDLDRLATELLGPAAKRRGRRVLWPCPFHNDRHPSFEVDTTRQTWKCWPCSLGGDAPALVMKLSGVAFPRAVCIVAELAGIATPTIGNKTGTKPKTPRVLGSVQPYAVPGEAASPPPERSSGLPPDDAQSLVTEATCLLWEPEGRQALSYLRGRGLKDETIRAARLGWTPRAACVAWKPPGVIIPWFEGERLAMVKVRPPDEWRGRFREEDRPPKYVEAFRDRPGVYPGIEAVEPGRPLVVAEGEFDSLLLGQELRDLAAAVTLGSASSRPEGGILLDLMAAAPWYLALDRDEAGDKAAAGWPARAIRVRPPGAYKDWTEAAQARVNLRRWWSDRLEGTEAPALFTWDELAAWRWRPALQESEPADDGSDPYDLAERLAIQAEYEP